MAQPVSSFRRVMGVTIAQQIHGITRQSAHAALRQNGSAHWTETACGDSVPVADFVHLALQSIARLRPSRIALRITVHIPLPQTQHSLAKIK